MDVLTIRPLDFDTPEQLARDAAHLILSSIDHALTGEPVSEDEIEEYIAFSGNNANQVHYGVIEESIGLIAVSEVIYESVDRRDVGFTTINAIAVTLPERGNGIGTLLMKHIGIEALKRGDPLISVYSVADNFFRKVGFSGPSDCMTATPTDILAS